MKKSFSFLLMFALISIIIIFSAYYVWIQDKAEVPEATLLKSFNYSGATIVNSEIYAWSNLSDEYNNLEKIKSLTEEISHSIGLVKNESLSTKVVENDLLQKVEVSGITNDNKIVNINCQLRKGKSESEKVISIGITDDTSAPGLQDERQKLIAILKKYKLKPTINSCITGCFDGKLDSSQLNDKCVAMFKEVEAKKVEGMRDERLISVSAYTPAIEESIMVNGKKVNMNLAIRYNTLENKTYIWLATPVITTEY